MEAGTPRGLLFLRKFWLPLLPRRDIPTRTVHKYFTERERNARICRQVNISCGTQLNVLMREFPLEGEFETTTVIVDEGYKHGVTSSFDRRKVRAPLVWKVDEIQLFLTGETLLFFKSLLNQEFVVRIKRVFVTIPTFQSLLDILENGNIGLLESLDVAKNLIIRVLFETNRKNLASLSNLILTVTKLFLSKRRKPTVIFQLSTKNVLLCYGNGDMIKSFGYFACIEDVRVNDLLIQSIKAKRKIIYSHSRTEIMEAKFSTPAVLYTLVQCCKPSRIVSIVLLDAEIPVGLPIIYSWKKKPHLDSGLEVKLGFHEIPTMISLWMISLDKLHSVSRIFFRENFSQLQFTLLEKVSLILSLRCVLSRVSSVELRRIFGELGSLLRETCLSSQLASSLHFALKHF